jgi:hypothetical protein
MNIARPVQILASENPFWLHARKRDGPCCLDLAGVLTTQGAAPIELLQNKACTPKPLQRNLSEPLAGWPQGIEMRSLPA